MLFRGEVVAHLQARTACPAAGAAIGGDDTLSLESLAAEGVVALGVELGVGRHAVDGSNFTRPAYQVGDVVVGVADASLEYPLVPPPLTAATL